MKRPHGRFVIGCVLVTIFVLTRDYEVSARGDIGEMVVRFACAVGIGLIASSVFSVWAQRRGEVPSR